MQQGKGWGAYGVRFTIGLASAELWLTAVNRRRSRVVEPDVERSRITDRLDSHQGLLLEHTLSMMALMVVVIHEKIPTHEMAFIVAEGRFAGFCLAEGCGDGFEVLDCDVTTVVVPIGCDDGLVHLLREMIPEGVLPVLARPGGATAVLVVDRDDEPAICLLPTTELIVQKAC